MERDISFHILYKLIIEQESSLSNYIQAQSHKLRALFSTEKVLTSNTIELQYIPLYKDVSQVMEFCVKKISLSLNQGYSFNNFKDILGFNNTVLKNDLSERISSALVNFLESHNLLMESIYIIIENSINKLKDEKEKHGSIIEQEIDRLINLTYELHELLIKKIEFFYSNGIVSNINIKSFHPLFKALHTSSELTRKILSSYHFESRYIEKHLRRKIISFIKLKNQIISLVEDHQDLSKQLNVNRNANFSSPWLSTKVQEHSKTEDQSD